MQRWGGGGGTLSGLSSGKVLNSSFFRYELKVSSTAKCVVLGDGVDWDTASPHCESKREKPLHGAIKIIVGTALG